MYADLLSGKTDTLSAFVIPRHQYQVKPFTTELEKLLLNKLCTAAATVIELQCAGEYFSDRDIAEPRTTQVREMTEEELEGFPTNNLDTERDLSVFDRLSKVAKMANRKFNATDIKNNMTQLSQNPELTGVAKCQTCLPQISQKTEVL